MPLLLSEITHEFETHIPLSLQDKWDKSGLQIGSPSQKISRVLFALDLCHEVVAHAVKKKCQLIVSHHPLNLTGFQRIDLDTYEGKIIQDSMKHRIALYAAHTNHDRSQYSLARQVVADLGLTKIKPIREEAQSPYCKVVVYVPHTHTHKVLEALFAGGAGQIGDYGECSFRVEGVGTFKGGQSTHPFLGAPGVREEVIEDRLEVIAARAKLKSAIVHMLKAHPYEEVAYDIIDLENNPGNLGMGMYGEFPKPVLMASLIPIIKKYFGNQNIQFIGKANQKISSVGFCNGSGASLLSDIIRKKIDLFITGDVKYHSAIDALRSGVNVVDVGHFESEIASADLLKKLFGQWFGKKLELHSYHQLKSPFQKK